MILALRSGFCCVAALAWVGTTAATEITDVSEMIVEGYVEVTGTGFGEDPGEMLIGGTSAPIAAWTPTEIVGYVPVGTPEGPTDLQVIDADNESDTFAVDVGPRPASEERVRWRQRFDALYAYARPVVGPDGTLYVLDNRYRLYAMTPQGGVKWVVDGGLRPDITPETPIFGNTSVDVGPDGTLYGAHRWYVSALNPDGSLKWRFDIPTSQRSYIVYDTKVGPDGNVYVAATHTTAGRLGVYSLTPDGTLRWNVEHIYDRTTRRQIDLVFGPGPQGPQGPQASQVYFSANQNSYAIAMDDGDVIFNNLPRVTGFAAVSPVDGTVHSSNYAYEPDGNILWQSPVFLNGALGMDSHGVHYCTASVGGPRIVALDPAGSVLYERDLDLPSSTSPETTTVTPDDELLLVDDIFHRLLVLRSSDGREEWRLELEPIEGRPQYWLRRPAFNRAGTTAYYQAAVNTAGIIRDRTFMYALAVGTTGDVNGDGVVDFSDLLMLLAAWGPCEGSCPADLDGNGIVDFNDLLILLANWS